MADTTDGLEEAIAWVQRLHEVIDELVAPLVARHRENLACRAGCTDCCTDGLTVFAVEAARIARRYPELLANGTPHDEGACAFLDSAGHCRVYEARPYVCRTQGLPLRWLEEIDHVEARDVCPKNFEGIALEELEPGVMWTIGPIEERLRVMQERQGGGGRVALRELFARPAIASSERARRRLPMARE